MKKTIFGYWPLAIVLTLAAAAYVHICSDAQRATQSPLAADEFTAELARAVSYGMVDGSSALPTKPMHSAPAMNAPVGAEASAL